jgi:hypothetical protein
MRELLRELSEAKRRLSVPEKHQLAIAKKTLKMPDAMVGVAGGPTKAEARAIIKKLTGR